MTDSKRIPFIYRFLSSVFLLSMILNTAACRADEDKIALFPLDHYDQTISTWINPAEDNYDKPLFSSDIQQKRFDTLIKHYVGAASPWSPEYVNHILHRASSDTIYAMEVDILADFTNVNKPDDQIGYGENFHPHTLDWINQIKENSHLAQFNDINYQANNRAIAVDNLLLRALPTNDPSFYSHRLAGQGYPFDNLQMSALWAGTPVYIIGETLDHAWSLVITPDCIAWTKTSGLARTDSTFISTWQSAAKKQLAAITTTETPILDKNHIWRFSAYIGSVFPIVDSGSAFHILIPIMDINRKAVITQAEVSNQQAVIMPLAATPHHFADVMNTLIGRPYGWGNLNFYNDCSAELKSLLTPFGIWLPRHSSSQVKAGKMVDVSYLPPAKRVEYLLENGRPFLTIIYIGGHVMLYTGKFSNPNTFDHSPMAMTYQNLWGIRPSSNDKRFIIGKAAFFPLLLSFPENRNLTSQASKDEFQVGYLDEVQNFLLFDQIIDLKSLMYPS